MRMDFQLLRFIPVQAGRTGTTEQRPAENDPILEDRLSRRNESAKKDFPVSNWGEDRVMCVFCFFLFLIGGERKQGGVEKQTECY